jgi:ribonuclease P protein component
MNIAGNNRFPRHARVVRPQDFRQVFAQASKSGDRFWIVLGTPNDLKYPRLGLAVSRKHAPRAVDRNRLKRMIRENFRTQQGLAAIDYVVMARPGTSRTSNHELCQSLQRHWYALADRLPEAS